MNISGATKAQGSSSQSSGGTGTGAAGTTGKAVISTKGGDVSDLAILWLGDSHARRVFAAVPEKTAAAAGYAWLAVQQGWENILDDIVGQIADCGGAAKVFLSLGSRLLNVSRLDHSQVTEYLLEIMKKWVGQGFSITIMELPFGTDRSSHVEIWRLNCTIRGLNSVLLGSSPAAGLMMQSVTATPGKTAELGLGDSFPMARNVANYSDLVHLRDASYAEVWEETLKEFQKNGFNDPKDPWIVEDGAVTTLAAPPGLLTSWGEFLEGKRLASEVQCWNPDELYKPPPQVQQQQQQQQQQLQQLQQTAGGWVPWANHRSRAGRTRGRGGWGRGRGRGSTGTRPYWARPGAARGHSGPKNSFVFY